MVQGINLSRKDYFDDKMNDMDTKINAVNNMYDKMIEVESEQISISAQLAHNEQQIMQKTKGVVNLEEYLNLVPNRNIATTPDQWDWTRAWKKAIQDIGSLTGGEAGVLFLGGRPYRITENVVIEFPLSIQGTYRSKTSKTFAGGSSLNCAYTGSEPFIKYQRGEHTDPGSNRLPGVKIQDITIYGNDANIDCLHLVKTGWEMNFNGVYIQDFKGHGVYTDTVYDSVITGLSIINCGGLIRNNKPCYALKLTSTKGDCTNALHFFGLHIERSRYMLDLGECRHIHIVGSKFEAYETMTITADLTNPYIFISYAAYEITFSSTMFIPPRAMDWKTLGFTTSTANSPYFIKGETPRNANLNVVQFDTCVFTTPQQNGEGAKLMDDGGARFSINNCYFNFIDGASHGIKLSENSSISNSQIIVTVSEGKAYGPEITNSRLYNNDIIRFQPSTESTITAEYAILASGTSVVIEGNRYKGFVTKVKPNSNGIGYLRKRTRLRIDEAMLAELFGAVDKDNFTLDLSKVDDSLLMFELDSNLTIVNMINGTTTDAIKIWNNKNAKTITIKNNEYFKNSIKADIVLAPNEYAQFTWSSWAWYDDYIRRQTL